jgi:superfamily I DNA/RNA helicase
LRHSSASGKKHPLDYRNFGAVKGQEFERVLVVPTGPIENFVVRGEALEGRSACAFYVAVTRAKHSVAIALSSKQARAAGLSVWRP